MAAPLNTFWTEDKLSEFQRHHGAGLADTAIAAAMNVTRNTAVAKRKRLGLTANPAPEPSEEERELKRQQRSAAAVKSNRDKRDKRAAERETKMQDAPPPMPQPKFIGSLDIPFGELRPWLSVGANQCRYIAAEPPGPDYLACGNETLPGESWCGHCEGIVFNRGQPYVAKKQEAA
jgi:hypothetical protein